MITLSTHTHSHTMCFMVFCDMKKVLIVDLIDGFYYNSYGHFSAMSKASSISEISFLNRGSD